MEWCSIYYSVNGLLILLIMLSKFIYVATIHRISWRIKNWITFIGMDTNTYTNIATNKLKVFYIYSRSGKYLACLLILIMMNNASLNRVVAFISLQDTDFVFIRSCLSYFLIAVIETPFSKHLRAKGSILTPSPGGKQSIAWGMLGSWHGRLDGRTFWSHCSYLQSGSRKWWVNMTTAHFNQCNQYNPHRCLSPRRF